MIRTPPRFTLTDPLSPSPTLCRSRLERADLVSRPPRLPGRAPRHQRRERGYLMAATTQAAFEDISQPAPQSVWVNGNEITAQAVLAEMQYHPAASAAAEIGRAHV